MCTQLRLRGAASVDRHPVKFPGHLFVLEAQNNLCVYIGNNKGCNFRASDAPMGTIASTLNMHQWGQSLCDTPRESLSHSPHIISSRFSHLTSLASHTSPPRHIVSPHLASHHPHYLSSPRLTALRIASHRLASLHLTSPHLPSPHNTFTSHHIPLLPFTSPHITSPSTHITSHHLWANLAL